MGLNKKAGGIGYFHPQRSFNSLHRYYEGNGIKDTDYGVPLTVGPTGSGANVIWAELDSIPVGAKAVRLILNGTAAGAAGTSCSIGVSVFPSSAAGSEFDYVFKVYADVPGSTERGNLSLDIPLDSGRKFKFQWRPGIGMGIPTDSSMLRVDLYIEGYWM